MRLRASLGVLSIALFAALLLAPGPVGAQEDSTPTLTTDRPAYDRGQSIRVEGEGWPARTVLSVELCGNDAVNGSVDCDARNATMTATTAEGALFVDLLAAAPPSPCPCVVHVFDPKGLDDLAVRVEIAGVPVAEVVAETETALREVSVTGLDVGLDNGFAASFGLAPELRVEVTVANTGDTPVDSADLRLRWGVDGDADRLIPTDPVGPLAPGESATVRADIRGDAVSFGRLEVSASVVGHTSEPRSADVSTAPTGLITLVVVVLGALFVRAVLRRRLPDDDHLDDQGPDGEHTADTAPSGEPADDVGELTAAGEVAAERSAGPVRSMSVRAMIRRISVRPLSVRSVPAWRGSFDHSASRRRGLAVGLGLVALGGALTGCTRSGDRSVALDADEVCAVLTDVDPGRSFGSGSAERLAAAAVRIDGVGDRAPEEIADAMAVIREAIAVDEAVLALPDLAQGDEGYSDAYQAAYALRFDQEVLLAAALLERHAVDNCGLEPSGVFDIEAIRDSDLQASAIPALTQAEMDELRIEFQPADVDGFELRPFEIPDVTFDQDLDQFRLELPDIPQPDLDR